MLFQASQSPEAGLREAAFRIFATTPGIIEKQHEDTVLGVFTKGFRDDNISVSAVFNSTVSQTVTFYSIKLYTLGSNRCHGSFCVVLPFNTKEIAVKILPLSPRCIEHLTTTEGSR